MTTLTFQRPPTEALELIGTSLDLQNLRAKLTDPVHGNGLSEVEFDLREAEYQKFLALKLAFPDEDIVPCKIVDEMWHAHILDTAAYRADCDAIFGSFVDHFPYFGIRDAEDAQDLQNAYSITLSKYFEAFGDPPPETWISSDASRCRTACKPMKCR